MSEAPLYDRMLTYDIMLTYDRMLTYDMDLRSMAAMLPFRKLPNLPNSMS